MLKVLNIISTLNIGGAETMLFRLVSRLDKHGIRCEVLSLTDRGPLGAQMAALGIRVGALGMNRGHLPLRTLPKLVAAIRESRPDVVQTWLYHSDLLGGLATRLAGRPPLVWGLRHGSLGPDDSKRSTLIVGRVCASLAGWLPTKIVSNSENVRRIHINNGYPDAKMLVIPNGFDLSAFRPDQGRRRAMRLQWEVPDDTLIIGLVGRFDPFKDHENFIRAASLLATQVPDARFVLCGDGVDWANKNLARWILQRDLKSRFILLGQRRDVSSIDAALDVATSSSKGEGFPNAIGEAMSCGVSCVVTDVGESAEVVGDTGIVVPRQDPVALAEAWRKMAELGPKGRAELGARARARITERFGIEAVVSQYAELYRSLASDRNGTP